MKKSIMRFLGVFCLAAFASLGLTGCPEVGAQTRAVSSTGVQQARAVVQTDAAGNTVEQKNIVERLKVDNQPGSIKHLYVISAYSGDVILYSAVRGKVTSSGKRLSPYSVSAQDGQYVDTPHAGMRINVGGQEKYTSEVLQDDGTYGSSDPYIYWFDTKGNYHQHYLSGGQVVHVSNVPLRVGKVIIRVDGADGS